MVKGYFCLILHAHLPFVRHPEHEDFLEEDWYYHALNETYLPLLHMMEGLERDRTDFRLTMTLSPPLLSMFCDPLLTDRYLRRLERLVDLSRKEIERTKHDPTFHELALMYHRHFSEVRESFVDRYRKDLVGAFRGFQERGKLEIITCAATHGYLPLMGVNPAGVRAQIRVAVRQYETLFGRKPEGIWLPECGYSSGIDAIVRDEGIRYFILETHGILYATPRPRYGVYAPIFCPSGVAAFGRDIESSKQVWSAIEGYPGDYEYRDFYRDIGYDLDFDYVRPHIQPTGDRKIVGIKYYKITGPTDHKEPYNRRAAMEKAAEHAGNFMFNREKQIEFLRDVIGKEPIVVAPYDAELFGHWWFEGPDFLNYLFRKVAHDQKVFKMITPGEYLKKFPSHQVCRPCPSSWGYKGYSEVWLDGANDWIYRHLHKATDRMVELADRFAKSPAAPERALNQAARELLLAQSSDWAFIMKMGTSTGYAVRRTKEHISNFIRLYEEILGNRVDMGWVVHLESRTSLFPDLDFRVYCSR
jgi:1,4-alpha-glucan branching enzyme